jgi:hypothetical protein
MNGRTTSEGLMTGATRPLKAPLRVLRAASEQKLKSPDFPILDYFIGFLKGGKMVHEAVVALRLRCAARGNHHDQYLHPRELAGS